jgi:hypothetical protein
MTLLQQFNTMLQKHNDFIQSMMGIAYERHDKEMQAVIEAHVKELRGILDEPATEHTTEYQQYDRENNPELDNALRSRRA